MSNVHAGVSTDTQEAGALEDGKVSHLSEDNEWQIREKI